MQLLSHGSTGLIGSYYGRCLQPLADFLVYCVCLAAVLPEYVLHGSFADLLARQVGYQLCDSLERDALDDVEVCHQRTEVVAVLDAAVGGAAVVHAAALTDLLAVLLLGRLDDQLDVDDLCLADLPVWYAFQRTATALAVGRFMLYDPVWFCDCL